MKKGMNPVLLIFAGVLLAWYFNFGQMFQDIGGLVGG